ncbi:immunoglobulin domain-containing protein [Flavobacterium humidisoli]|uniref:Protein involved in gliding motility SprC n=1 Tax=Flavobacterium humidisoli TaxID=2937442 RepID=A0ABY4M1P1_9FLAO|nr:hypothetical protein [Flavobacterium humidisoli]UPZ17845.1 hypothetical protein M0M44_10960 [Flavobacterium humidisoli]
MPFDRICAGSEGGNDYSVTFSYDGFNAQTVFAVELSKDNFGTIVLPETLSAEDSGVNQKTIRFAIPSDIVGSDNYCLRVSAAGFSSGKFLSFGLKNYFPIYYKVHDRQFTINNFNGDATYCFGSNYLLAIDGDSKLPANDSPLKFGFLTYNWYRDNGVSQPPTLVAGASGPSYSVNSDGVYYVETNYGGCSSQSYSNRVAVTSSGSGSEFIISSSLGNPFCPTADGTVLTAPMGKYYSWKKNGVAFGGNSRNITVKDPGLYTVAVDSEGCSSAGSINLKTNGINAVIDAKDEFELKDGESISVTVTTDASQPIFEWYLDNKLIASATADTYAVKTSGVYRVKVTQISECLSSKEFIFRVKDEMGTADLIPNIVRLDSPYWKIPDIYKTPAAKILILNSNGEVLFDDVGSAYDPMVNSFIKDFKNVNPVYYYVIKYEGKIKKGSITVIK